MTKIETTVFKLFCFFLNFCNFLRRCRRRAARNCRDCERQETFCVVYLTEIIGKWSRSAGGGGGGKDEETVRKTDASRRDGGAMGGKKSAGWKTGRKQRWKADSVAERWTSVFFSRVLFTGSSFGKTDGCIHSGAFYCIFPKPVNSLYHHLCVGKLWLALLLLVRRWQRLLFWLERGLVYSAPAAGHDFEEFVSPLALSGTALLHGCGTHRVSPAWN